MPKKPESGKSSLLLRFTRPQKRRLQVEVTSAIVGELELVTRYIRSETGVQPSLDELVETMLLNQLRIIAQTEPGFKSFAAKQKAQQSLDGQGKSHAEKQLESSATATVSTAT